MIGAGCRVFYWDEESLQCSLTNSFVSRDLALNHIGIVCQWLLIPCNKYKNQKSWHRHFSLIGNIQRFKCDLWTHFQNPSSLAGDVSGTIVLPVSDPDNLIHICPPYHSTSYLPLSLPFYPLFHMFFCLFFCNLVEYKRLIHLSSFFCPFCPLSLSFPLTLFFNLQISWFHHFL